MSYIYYMWTMSVQPHLGMSDQVVGLHICRQLCWCELFTSKVTTPLVKMAEGFQLFACLVPTSAGTKHMEIGLPEQGVVMLTLIIPSYNFIKVLGCDIFL